MFKSKKAKQTKAPGIDQTVTTGGGAGDPKAVFKQAKKTNGKVTHPAFKTDKMGPNAGGKY